MIQLQVRQFAWSLVEGLREQGLSRERRTLQSRRLKRVHIELCDIAPDHLTANPIGVLAHRMAARIVPQQANDFTGNSRGISEGNQDAAIVSQQFGRVPIWR